MITEVHPFALHGGTLASRFAQLFLLAHDRALETGRLFLQRVELVNSALNVRFEVVVLLHGFSLALLLLPVARLGTSVAVPGVSHGSVEAPVCLHRGEVLDTGFFCLLVRGAVLCLRGNQLSLEKFVALVEQRLVSFDRANLFDQPRPRLK